MFIFCNMTTGLFSFGNEADARGFDRPTFVELYHLFQIVVTLRPSHILSLPQLVDPLLSIFDKIAL